MYSKLKIIVPKRSVFPMRQRCMMDVRFGVLYPVFRRIGLPGDYWKVSPRMQITMMPLIAPIMSSIKAYIHYFFVPLRLLFKRVTTSDGNVIPDQVAYQMWISGGKDNNYNSDWPEARYSDGGTASNVLPRGGLSDYFGFRVGVPVDYSGMPSTMWRRAYNLVYNYFYRREDYQDEVDWDSESLQYRNWMRDYFTGLLPNSQRGDTVHMFTPGNFYPLVGRPTTSAYNSNITNIGYNVSDTAQILSFDSAGSNNYIRFSGPSSSTNVSANAGFHSTFQLGTEISDIGISIESLRLANALQRWQELNMRAGIRYTELLMAHFGVSPHDDVLQEPQYIGGVSSPVQILKVAQTGGTTSNSAQGNLAGNGGAFIARDNIVRYHVKEFGVMIGILSVMPRTLYQYGNGREFTIRNRYDLPWPLFQGLGEQQVLQQEIFASESASENRRVIGYRGRFDEYRNADDYVCGMLRSDHPQSLDYWHMARKWNQPPSINGDFLKCNPDMRNFAVQDIDGVPAPEMVLDMVNHCRVVRPLTRDAIPHL